MLESLYNGSDIAKGLLVTVIGMTGVFTVLVIFYLLIKVFAKVFPNKSGSGNEK
jgi:Na+-transporting methylmalonyl-CoA/oxaloacetate decarboxylase gamma subunit